MKKLVGQHDSQSAITHARRAGREDYPLAERDPLGRIDPVGHGDRGDVGPLRAGSATGLRLELPLGAGGDHDRCRAASHCPRMR